MLQMRHSDIIVVVSSIRPEMEINIRPDTENGTECLNTYFELKQFNSVNEMMIHLIVGTADEVLEKYPDSDGISDKSASKEDLEHFCTSAIVNRINEELSSLTKH